MKQFYKIFFLMLLAFTNVFAQDETGSATIILFHDGLPLQNNEVLIDGKYKHFTDEDGAVEIILETGKHQVEIFAKDDNKQLLGYVKRTIQIKDSRDTQVITTFSNDSLTPYVDIDTPVGTSDTTMASTTKGTLQGKVISSQDNKPIANARIFVKGTSIDVRTDANGVFTIEVPADTNLSLSVVHSEYSSQTLNNILVKEKGIKKLTLQLTPISMELEEFIVLAPQVKGSIAAVMMEEKTANAITNIVGQEQISRKGDSDAAGALKRITGVTIVDGKDVYVRGLGGRYSNVEMNSMPLPSPDPQRRTVPLDIFPASVIGSLKVQKSATADIPANFGGGYVDVRTKEQTKENYFRVITEIKANSYTGKQVDTYKGSATDFLGFDDGYRAIPGEILSSSAITVGEGIPNWSANQQAQYAKDIIGSRSFATYKEALAPGGKLAVEGSYALNIDDKNKLSFFGNYTYDQAHTYRNEKYYAYGYNQASDTLYTTPTQFGDVYRTTDTYKNAAIFNAHYNYADVLNLKFTQLFSVVSEKVTKIVDGISGSNDDWRVTYDLNWEERTLNVSQLSGDALYQLFNTKNKFSFGVETSTANLDQPSNVKYEYYKGNIIQQIANPYLDRYGTNAFLNLTTDDKLNAFYIKNRTDLEIFAEGEYLEIGLSSSSKTRESRYNKYRMELSENGLTGNIDTIYEQNIDSFDLAISFQPAYWYDATVDDTSTYFNIFVKPMQKLEVFIGARQNSYQQKIYQYTNNNNYYAPVEKVPGSLAYNSILPSGNIKYIFDTSNQINFAFSQTYIVPDLREFSDAEYYHPYERATVKGNSDLTYTDITSYDLKYSHYFSATENINIGLFYKYLDKPIEDVLLPTSSLPRYGYANADYATLYGFELDGRKNFSFIAQNWKYYYISGNFSYTDSEVVLTQDQANLYTTNHRQLQGLSPIVINTTLGYENKRRSVTVSYNKMGERIRRIGMVDAGEKYPDTYEVPPAVLDFVWIEKLKNHIQLKLKLKNLLDEETVWYQGSRANVTNKFKVGRFYSFSFSYKY